MSMDYKNIMALVGKELADEDVKAFLDQVGIKYPKKDTISASASDWDLGLSGKKAGVYLNFSIDVLNRKYKVNQADRKGVFKPILTEVDFKENTQCALSFSVIHYDEQEKKNAKMVSTIYGKAIDAESIKEEIFFILWAVDNGYLYLGETLKGDVEKLHERKMDVPEFALKAFRDNPFITLDNFVNVDKDFVNDYYNNPYLDDIYSPIRGQYYRKDFQSTFSKKDDELKVAADISKLQYSEENRWLVSEMINKRYGEFKKLQEKK